MPEGLCFDDDAPAASGFAPRDYQLTRIDTIYRHWPRFPRILLEMATGTGKTTVAAEIFRREVAAGRRCLFLANRDKLVRQSAHRITAETGVEAAIEMAGESASPQAMVVVASVQTLARVNRLSAFADDHFDLIVADESHHVVAETWLRVLNYFHIGAESLAEGWVAPPRGTYQHKARVLGITATPIEELAEFFDYFVEPPYSLISAVEDGWLVPPTTKSMPLRIDIRDLRPGRTPNGSDFRAGDLSRKLEPVIGALAEQVAALAKDRKTIAFTPSIHCAKLLADAITAKGMTGIFVSGECLDVDEKTQRYVDAGPGTVLVNAALYTEGADFPDTDCVLVARATKSKGFYRQLVGRGTRVLPGVVNQSMTAEERRAAIAASKKPNLLILDPLWIHERIDLCDALDAVADTAEIKEKMKKSTKSMLDAVKDATRDAERDLIKTLEKEARKHSKKQPRTIDPLAWAVSVGDEVLASYVPETTADARPPARAELDFILQAGIDTSAIKTTGLAQKVIARIRDRERLGLASVRQMNFLKQLGIPDPAAVKMNKRQAAAIIGKRFFDWAR